MHYHVNTLSNLATQNHIQTGIALSFAAGIIPAFLIGKDSHKLLAATALQVATSMATNYLKENEYISSFQKAILDYACGSFVYGASYHSVNAAITNSMPLKSFPILGDAIYSFGSHNVAKAFAFGMIPLPIIVAADNFSKNILQIFDPQHNYTIGDTYLGLYESPKYFTLGLGKYYMTPDLHALDHKSKYLPLYLAVGAAEGFASSCIKYYFQNKTDLKEFAKQSIELTIDHSVSCALYNTIGDEIFASSYFDGLRENYPATAFVPISIAVEETGLILREYLIPNATNYYMDNFGNTLHNANENITHFEL